MGTTTQTRSGLSFGRWVTERLGLQGISYAVPEYVNSLPYTLGGITLSGFLILIATGIYLAHFYHPETGEAHQSIIYIITHVPLGDTEADLTITLPAAQASTGPATMLEPSGKPLGQVIGAGVIALISGLARIWLVGARKQKG